ncbi:RdgB/HAM1 family non-canonical purine NTP pyrophosphatase [Segetibacter sp.]|jgi:XTP/dITP diphosphohydrolase|uniref:RdgB/HAM1 family non-canonical purine NTP pyrophosphatase n=1 Tax=Segetibacter sp. TaxID=2231182 RepID=UPI002610B0A9|nr:RdgB/HAM1 family non-canonical purine NTP pyrophosphatase [Segetibacter sp.]MCW3080476.1 nucleoside 5-triphosphatase RdgB [Segetibacter sp.]
MKKIIFATNNQNKVEEIRSIIEDFFEVISLKEAGINIDIPEPHATLEENASEKSKTIHAVTGENCFSEDTGLEVEALNGEPGVKSARYAGEGKSANDNLQKLLHALKGAENRKARFRTVISLIINNSEELFEGICEGEITEVAKGHLGFGYDSIFIPDGANKTFAEMVLAEKNQYSHRKKATMKLASFLSTVGKNSCI